MNGRIPYLLLGIVPMLGGGVQAASDVAGVPTSVVITLESKGSGSPQAGDISLSVTEEKSVRPISSVKQVTEAPAQMLLLIDDSAGAGFDSQIGSVKKFVTSLPENFEIGIGYMHNGTSQMTSDFTADHAKAAASIRLAMGAAGADVSPYDSLSDAIKKWPKRADVERREVVMISSGLEGLGGGLPPDNPYVNAGIADAQKAGVVVYAIYNPGFGHEGHSLWRATAGQNFLSQLVDETGGELYQIGFGSAVSFDPYFEDILKRQSQQYVLTFDARPEKKSGLQSVKIRSTEKGMSVAGPDKIYVKASL